MHIRPKVPFCTIPTATRHQIMVTANEMDRMDCPYRHNALGRIIPLLWRGGRPMHFVMHAFNNHVKVLHDVTPIDFDISIVLGII